MNKQKIFLNILFVCLAIVVFMNILYILKHIVFVNINMGDGVTSYKTFYCLKNVIDNYYEALESKKYEVLDGMTLYRGKNSNKVYDKILTNAEEHNVNIIEAKKVLKNMYRCVYKYNDSDERIMTILLDETNYSYVILYSKLV